jgi:hypothetical protein
MQSIAKMHTIMANHHVVMQALDEVRQNYFDEVYELNLLEAKNCCLEEEVKYVELHRRMQEAKKKEKESDIEVDTTIIGNYNKHDEQDSQSQGFVSHWLQLVCETEVTQQDLVKSVLGNELACVHNRDSNNFMNETKFDRFILQCSNNDVPMSWDSLDETGSCIVEEVVEDKDQGPSKNGGHMDGTVIPPKNRLSWPVQGSQNS